MEFTQKRRENRSKGEGHQDRSHQRTIPLHGEPCVYNGSMCLHEEPCTYKRAMDASTLEKWMHPHREPRDEGWGSSNKESWLVLFMPSANGLGMVQHHFLCSKPVSSSQIVSSKYSLMPRHWHSDRFLEIISSDKMTVSTYIQFFLVSDLC